MAQNIGEPQMTQITQIFEKRRVLRRGATKATKGHENVSAFRAFSCLSWTPFGLTSPFLKPPILSPHLRYLRHLRFHSSAVIHV